MYVYTHIYKLNTALFVTAKLWKQPRYPTIGINYITSGPFFITLLKKFKTMDK